MKRTIQSGSLSGAIQAPSSKSFAQRAILAALLAPGTSRLKGFEWSDDNLHALYAAMSLGAEVRYIGEELEITGSREPRTNRIFAGESGLASRLLSAILMIYDRKMELTGSGSLLRRPFGPMMRVYEQLDVSFSVDDGRLPLKIEGPLKPADVRIDGSMSSQFVSGLLMALPAADFRQTLTVEHLSSRPYVEMTTDMLTRFGVHWIEENPNQFRLVPGSTYRQSEYFIEGDWSGAAFLITAGLLAGDLEISGLSSASKQADRAILDLVDSQVNFDDKEILHIKRATKIPEFIFDATHCPDLFPPLVVLATAAEGPSQIRGVHRLRYKESNRADTLKQEFSKLGIRIEIKGDDMIVFPGIPSGGRVDAHNDHRIAMGLAVAALRAKGTIEIEGAESVSKSYPAFWSDLTALGARID